MNLVIERSLQQAEVQGVEHVDVAGISAAAAPLQLGARTRPFRWLARRVS
jgi:hypothetical protein